MFVHTQEKNLQGQLRNQLKQLNALLMIYYKNTDVPLSEREIEISANKKLSSIVLKNCQTIYDQYNAVLEWCRHIEEDDLFQVIKTEFMKLHVTVFADRLQSRLEGQSAVTRGLLQKIRQYQIIYKTDMEQGNQRITEIKAYLEKLQHMARRISVIKLPPDHFHEFQSYVKTLKILVTHYFKQENPPAVTLLPLKRMSFSRDLIENNQKRALDVLDKNIKQYQLHLKQQGFLARFLAWFSPARKRRHSALALYEKNVMVIKDTHARYQAARSWARKHGMHSEFNSGKSTSRFYRHCLVPFQKECNQIDFESIKMLQTQNQNEVNELVSTLHNATDTHNNQVKELNESLKRVEKTASTLRESIYSFTTCIDDLRDDGLGYVQNSTSLIRDHINNISYQVAQLNESKPIQALPHVIQTISQINRQTSDEEIQQIKQQANNCASNKKTLTTIAMAVDKVIQDTIQYGGKGNNFFFMGTAQAERVVKALGTLEQKNHFRKEVKPEAIKKAQELYQQREQSFTTTLRRELKLGHLQKKLTLWHKVYQKHIDNTLDESSEIIYRNEIESENAKAHRFHEKSCGELEKLVNDVMLASLNASQFNLGARINVNALGSLEWEQADMFVILYGTSDQIKTWDEKILPIIQDNLGVVKRASDSYQTNLFKVKAFP